MTMIKKIQFVTEIKASPAQVYDLMIDAQSYRDWASAFVEGSRYEGSWEKGQAIRFYAPNGDGMVAEIADNQPHKFISIRLLGYISHGVEDTTSEAIRAWAPAYENYTFMATANGTQLIVDQDVTEDFEDYMCEAWPKALERLKVICELA